MITREEILKSPEYWFEVIQNDIYRMVNEYLENKHINQTQLAEELGVTKGYVSQIMNGNFNYTLKKLIELSTSLGQAPVIKFEPMQQVLANDAMKHFKMGVQTQAFGGNNLSIAPNTTQANKGNVLSIKFNHTNSIRELYNIPA